MLLSNGTESGVTAKNKIATARPRQDCGSTVVSRLDDRFVHRDRRPHLYLISTVNEPVKVTHI